MRRGRATIIAAVLGLSLLAGCDGSAGSQVHAGETIRIGLNLETTGPRAAYGDAALKGAQTAFNAVNEAGGINGRQIELVWVDNASSQGKAAALSTQLMTKDKVLAVFGPITEDMFTVTTSIANKQEIVTVSSLVCNAGALARTDTEVNPYAFSTCMAGPQQGAAMANFAADELSAKTALVLRAAEGFGNEAADGFTEAFEEAGGSVTAQESFSAGETDLTRFVGLLQSNPADVVYVAGGSTEAAHVIWSLRSSGLSLPILGTSAFNDPALMQIGGPGALSGIYYTGNFSPLDTENPRVQQFIEAYRVTWGGAEPDEQSALAYDAALLIIDAVTRAKQSTGVDVRDAMAATANLEGATGRFSIGPNHEVVRDGLIIELVEGNPTSVTHVAP